jgi:hypothetical protein
MPRPFQVAPYFDIKFKVENSNTSATSAAPSGHCFAGLIIGYLIYLSQKKFFDDISNINELNRLIIISLDIGFHRNMAGIHFLYDNYISYIVFKQVLIVYKYETKNKFIKILSNKLDKIFQIYEYLNK